MGRRQRRAANYGAWSSGSPTRIPRTATRWRGWPPSALAPFARAESGLATRLQTLASASEQTRAGRIFSGVNWAAVFGWLADRHGLTLAPAQEAGVRMALTAPVA